MAIIETESEPEAPPMETESLKRSELSYNATVTKGTFGRGRPKLIKEAQTFPKAVQTRYQHWMAIRAR